MPLSSNYPFRPFLRYLFHKSRKRCKHPPLSRCKHRPPHKKKNRRKIAEGSRENFRRKFAEGSAVNLATVSKIIHLLFNIFIVDSSNEKNLKYLEIVQVSALQSVLYFAKLYEYAKENSGPMKPGVESVEGTVKKVVGPVYQKYHDVPIDFLKFVDQKVDESVTKVENTVPPVLKQASSQAFSAAQNAPSAVRSIASEVKNTGVIGTAKSVYIKYEPTAKELYSKYELTAEKYAVSTWRSLNKLPIFPQVAQAVVPAASYVSERYNLTVQKGAEKGFTVASYLPLVPTEKIAKLFSGDNVDPAMDANSGGIAAGNPVSAN